MTLFVPLLRVRDLQVVEAVLMPMTDKHLEEAERLWIPLLQSSSEEDEYWNWVRKQRESSLPGSEFYAIECENVTQGLLAIDILKKRCQLDSQARRRLVYILALATAPWNRPTILDPPIYKGVGGQFVDFAIARSRELGYQGRIGLHSLPRALNFYRKLRVNLLECGSDPDEPDHLVYFERFGDRDD